MDGVAEIGIEIGDDVVDGEEREAEFGFRRPGGGETDGGSDEAGSGGIGGEEEEVGFEPGGEGGPGISRWPGGWGLDQEIVVWNREGRWWTPQRSVPSWRGKEGGEFVDGGGGLGEEQEVAIGMGDGPVAAFGEDGVGGIGGGEERGGVGALETHPMLVIGVGEEVLPGYGRDHPTLGCQPLRYSRLQ